MYYLSLFVFNVPQNIHPSVSLSNHFKWLPCTLLKKRFNGSSNTRRFRRILWMRRAFHVVKLTFSIPFASIPTKVFEGVQKIEISLCSQHTKKRKTRQNCCVSNIVITSIYVQTKFLLFFAIRSTIKSHLLWYETEITAHKLFHHQINLFFRINVKLSLIFLPRQIAIFFAQIFLLNRQSSSKLFFFLLLCQCHCVKHFHLVSSRCQMKLL